MEKMISVIFKWLIISVLFLKTGFSFAAIPSMEGLFQNGSNADISSEVIIFRFILEEVDKVEEKTSSEQSSDESAPEIEKEKMPTKFVEMIFLPAKKDQRVKVIYNEYTDAGFSPAAIVRSLFHNDFRKAIENDGYLARNLLHSTLLMYTLNDSRKLIDLIKVYNSDFKTNKELMSREKVQLLKKYENYLKEVKGDKDLAAELESPMNPADENKKAIVDQIKNSRMYEVSDSVKLIKDGAEFYWSIMLDKMTATFDNENHNLQNLDMSVTDGTLKLSANNYTLFSGKYNIPKYLLIKDINDRHFQVTTTKLTHFSKSSKTDKERHNEFIKQIKQNGNENAQVEPLSTDLIY